MLPAGVDATVADGVVRIKGPQTTLTVPLPPHASVTMQEEPRSLLVHVADPELVSDRAIWGLTRQLLQNAVEGAQKPFVKSLEFVGVGFKVALQGRTLHIEVGYSHPVDFALPEGIEAKVEKQVVVLSGSDKQQLGEIAARIRRIRPPEPYKGKGIKYVNEVIRRKAGKTAKTSA